MPRVTLTYGLPASGKSKWAKQQVADSSGQIVRVNMDDIRAMIGLPYSASNEQIALKFQDALILSAIAQGKDVIVDNTHITSNMPNRYKKLFHGEVEFKVQDFTDVHKLVCITRDQHRDNPVGSQVINRMADSLQSGKFKLTAEYMNDYRFPLTPFEVDEELPLAVVFDIDGTLAEHVARSPYDYSRVGTDKVIERVRMLTEFYYNSGYTVILCSGRPDVWNEYDVREMTEDWLVLNSVPYDHLYMRDGIDQRDWNDADVKHNIINEHFRGKYNIENWYDDRNRVVNRVRLLGIPVSQVAPGDF